MAGERRVVEEYFEKFATTTVIRVFNFIRMSPTLVERLFWIAVLIGFTATTAWNVETTIQTFYSEPTASQISYVVNTTDGLRFDDAVICLEVLSNKLVTLYNLTGDDVIRAVVEGNGTFIEVLKEKLSKVHKAEDQRANWLRNALRNKSASESPEVFLEFYHAFEKANFELFTPQEVALLGLTTVMFSRLIDLETDPKVFYVNWHSAAIGNLHQAHVEKNVNFSKLFELFAEMTCAVMQIRVVRSEYDLDTSLTEYTPYNFCKNLSILRYFGTFGDTETICYPIRKNTESPLFFRNMFDDVVISIHPEPLYEELAADLKHFSIDLEGTLASEQRYIAGRFHHRQVVEFSLDTQSVSVNLRRKPCSTKETRIGSYDDCTFWCRLEALTQACGCVPLFGQFVPKFGTLPPANQSCAITLGNNFSQWSTHDRCSVALTAKYEPRSPNCSRQCHPNCERLIFGSTVQKEGTNGTFLALRSTKFVYQKVDEYLTMDSRGLVTALGGNLSLWLGASFLALIHIVVFFVKLPLERCARSDEEMEHKLTLAESQSVRRTALATNKKTSAPQDRSATRDAVIDLESDLTVSNL